MARIELKPHFEKIVEDQLARGRFADAGAVVEAALSLLQDRQAERDEAFASVRVKIRQSVDDPRPSIPEEEVFARLEAKFARRNDAAESD